MDKKILLYLEDVAEQGFRTGKDSELFFDPKTGDLWRVSDHPRFSNPDLSLDEALELEEDHKLIRLPKARDLHELDLMDEYTDYVDDELARELITVLRQSNPFQSFRFKLERAGLLEDYYQYRNERGADSLEEWCLDHEIPYRHQLSLKDCQAGYTVRRLDDRDAGTILRLMQTNPQFFKVKPPAPGLRQVKTDLYRVPPKSTLDQKFYIGWFDDNGLIALADVILDYPQDLQAWIGLFMVDGHEQQAGLGSRLLKALEGALARAGFAHIELGVRPNNQQGLGFWEKNGYQPVKKGEDLWILAKDQELPEESYEPEFDDELSSWSF